MKLVGSRANGTAQENSDWDFMLSGIFPVGVDSPECPAPCWGQPSEKIHWKKLEKLTRQEYNILDNQAVDFFYAAKCLQRKLYAIVNMSGYVVGMADTLENAIHNTRREP